MRLLQLAPISKESKSLLRNPKFYILTLQPIFGDCLNQRNFLLFLKIIGNCFYSFLRLLELAPITKECWSLLLYLQISGCQILAVCLNHRQFFLFLKNFAELAS